MRVVEGKDLCLPERGFVETQKGFLNSPKLLFKYWDSSILWHGAMQVLCHMVGVQGTGTLSGLRKKSYGVGGGIRTGELRSTLWPPSK